MRKHDYLTTMIVLIVLGTTVIIKAMILAITSAAAFQAATMSDHAITAAPIAKPKVIAPAPVVDLFVRSVGCERRLLGSTITAKRSIAIG